MKYNYGVGTLYTYHALGYRLSCYKQKDKFKVDLSLAKKIGENTYSVLYYITVGK